MIVSGVTREAKVLMFKKKKGQSPHPVNDRFSLFKLSNFSVGRMLGVIKTYTYSSKTATVGFKNKNTSQNISYMRQRLDNMYL